MFLSSLILFSAQTVAVNFGARLHESDWSTSGSPFQCMLSHGIPGYGEARFVQRAGGDLVFTLGEGKPILKAEQVRLVSEAPPWRHEERDVELGYVPLTKKRSLSFKLAAGHSQRLFEELERGMAPAFHYVSLGGEGTAMEVSVSPVNLRPALGEFLRCVSQLLPFEFEEVRWSGFYYASGGNKLAEKSRRRLEQVARYLLADKSVARVRIEGYTDDRGRRRSNFTLARRRAEAVQRYLVQQGVSADRIVVKSHGEHKPVASNRTEAGRAKNRRVVVVLER